MMRRNPDRPIVEPIVEVADAAGWHAWLAANHGRSRAALLRIPKAGRGTATLTYSEALDVALAWGWIDGQKRGLDDSAWLQRFTPRTAKSPWSKINRARAEALLSAGKMQPPGLAEVERARSDGRWERAYDGPRTSTVPDDLAAALARLPKARAFFESLDSANRYSILYRLQTAKTDQTRAERIAKFVTMCARGETLHPRRASKRPRGRSSLA
jgi:uncharacterized protein YdeI (YjbR/CyaY-like superfamily)